MTTKKRKEIDDDCEENLFDLFGIDRPLSIEDIEDLHAKKREIEVYKSGFYFNGGLGVVQFDDEKQKVGYLTDEGKCLTERCWTTSWFKSPFKIDKDVFPGLCLDAIEKKVEKLTLNSASLTLPKPQFEKELEKLLEAGHLKELTFLGVVPVPYLMFLTNTVCTGVYSKLEKLSFKTCKNEIGETSRYLQKLAASHKLVELETDFDDSFGGLFPYRVILAALKSSSLKRLVFSSTIMWPNFMQTNTLFTNAANTLEKNREIHIILHDESTLVFKNNSVVFNNAKK